MEKSQNLVLIGMSGAGKSTLGVLAAKALNKQFVDTDLLLQEKAGQKLQDILDNDGVEPFLALEEEVVSTLKLTNTVISTGGSVVYSEKIMAHLRENGLIVYLSVPYDVLTERLTNVSARGIVIRSGNTLEDVFRERLPLYETYADKTLDCAAGDIETCLENLIDAVGRK